MPIGTIFQEIAESWPAYAAHKTVDSQAKVHLLVTQELPTALKANLEPTSNLVIEGSTGAGNITAAPWVGVFNPRITSGATNGYYIVYLFSVDLRSVTLCIAFGTTQFEKQFGGPGQAFPRMREAASRLHGLFQNLVPKQYSREPIDLGATRNQRLHFAYEQSAIFSLRPYRLNNLPLESELISDFRETVRIYILIVEDPIRPDIEELLQSSIPNPGVPDEIIVDQFAPREPVQPKSGGQGQSKRRRYHPESRKVGDAGELAVIEYEGKKLLQHGLENLIKKIDHHAARGDFPGWDITSFDEGGQKIYIEVKSSIGNTISSLDLTSNEWAAAKHENSGSRYRLYMVTNALSKNPHIEIMQNPAKYVSNGILTIEPIVFQLSLRKSA